MLIDSRASLRRFLLRVTSGIGVVAFLAGWLTTAVYPPEATEQPRTVFLVDHGRHTSLVITSDDGRLLRWAYGDWRYYADQDTSLSAGVQALLWPTPATLARGELSGPPDLATLRSRLRVGIEEIHQFEVAGVDADRVVGQLESIHREGFASHEYVPAYDMVFAPHPEPYTVLNNSATVVAGWLSDLGAGVEGWGLVASWQVVTEESR